MLAVMFGSSSMAFAQEYSGNGPFADLTEEQIEELKEVRSAGDKDKYFEKLQEFGVDLEKAKKTHKKRNFRKMISEQLTDEQLEAVKEAKEDGATREEIKEKLEAYGVDLPEKKERFEHKEEVREAVDAGDYDAFQKYTEGTKIEEHVDEETFEAMVKAHDLREDGNYEEARTVIKETIDEENKPFFKRIWNKRKDKGVESEKVEGEQKGFFSRVFKIN